jgi:hypothetical protein
MKKISTNPGKAIASVLCICLTLMIFCTASAQNPKNMSAENRAKKITEWMKTNLQLKDDQVSKVQDINLKYANKMDEVKNSSGSKQDKTKTMKTNEDARDNELKSVLSDEQFKTYQSKKAELKKSMKEKGKQRKQQHQPTSNQQ